MNIEGRMEEGCPSERRRSLEKGLSGRVSRICSTAALRASNGLELAFLAYRDVSKWGIAQGQRSAKSILFRVGTDERQSQIPAGMRASPVREQTMLDIVIREKSCTSMRYFA